MLTRWETKRARRRGRGASCESRTLPSVNALCVWWRTCQARTPYWDVDHRTGFERGVRRTGPGIISTRIIIDDRPLRGPDAARRGAVRLSLGCFAETRSWAGGYYGRTMARETRKERRQILSDGYYLSMEIDLERCQSSRLRSIRSNREYRAILYQSERPVVQFW